MTPSCSRRPPPRCRRHWQTLGGPHGPAGEASLVVANTLSAWWGVHLAHAAGRPSLLYIHESTSPNGFFRGLLPAPALAVVEETFRLASRVSFLTATTQRYYTALSDGSNYCLNPGWIDLAAIARFRAAHTRETLRSRLGIAPGRKLVINVGTVCERKGQHLFARAVNLLWENAPDLAAAADFVMIGGRDTPYDRDLAKFLTQLNRPNLRVLPETGGIYDFYGAADLFVCSSYEESFPRVVLEAMAFALPIASTEVHGIPEMARPDREALLVPAGGKLRRPRRRDAAPARLARNGHRNRPRPPGGGWTEFDAARRSSRATSRWPARWRSSEEGSRSWVGVGFPPTPRMRALLESKAAESSHFVGKRRVDRLPTFYRRCGNRRCLSVTLGSPSAATAPRSRSSRTSRTPRRRPGRWKTAASHPDVEHTVRPHADVAPVPPAPPTDPAGAGRFGVPGRRVARPTR